jgi:transposase
MVLCLPATSLAKRRAPAGGRVAIVVDERLSALRTTPELNGALLRRLGRGSFVAVRGERRARDGVVFYRVNVTSRTSGWVQRDALVSPWRAGDDGRLLQLIKGSDDFDRIVRARIFLDNFSGSEVRPEALVIYALAAEDIAAHLSRDAARRLNEAEMIAGGAPLFSYFLNFNGLDRYNRQGITFTFDARNQQFHYDGEAWRELVHRYPRSPQAAAARKRLANTSSTPP